MDSNYDCISLERLIDLVIIPAAQPEMVHLILCEDCMGKFKGLQLSQAIERKQNRFLTNADFKAKRIKEVEGISKIYGAESIAVDMTVKCGFQLQLAKRVFSDLTL